MIKVGFYNFFASGGIGQYAHMLLEELSNYPELDLHLICSPEFEWQQIDGVQVHPILFHLSHPIPIVRKSRFLIANWINPLRAIKLAQKLNLDALYFSEINYLTFPVWKHKLKISGIKTVVAAHDVKRSVAIINKKYEDQQLINLYKSSDAILVHSEYQKQELVSFADVAPSGITIVPHGPYPYPAPMHDRNTLRDQYSIPQDASLALSFGSVRDLKNLTFFLEAVAKGPKNIHVLVAGPYGSKHLSLKYYRNLCEQLNIKHRVYFIDRYIKNEEVGDLFEMSDWVALPYKKTFTSQSGVLNVAAFFRKYVFTSDAPVISETVQKAKIGIACRDDTPEALLEGLPQIESLSKCADKNPFLAYEEDFSWKENAEITLNTFKSILNRQ